jgi:hypothetical protein
LREELLMMLAAGRDLSVTEDEQLVEGFLDRLGASLGEVEVGQDKGASRRMPAGIVAVGWLARAVFAAMLVLPITFIRQDATGMHLAVASWYYVVALLALGAVVAVTWAQRHTLWDRDANRGSADPSM